MQNIEIKVRVPGLDLIRQRVEALGAVFHWRQWQIDTYFAVPNGRLKLRETEGEAAATLITYARADETISTISQYQLMPVSDPETLKQILEGSLGVLATVRKTRELYIFGGTRIHLDEVTGLGMFLELETVLGEQPMEIARQEHQLVLTELRLDEYESVALSYSDLILSGQIERR